MNQQQPTTLCKYTIQYIREVKKFSAQPTSRLKHSNTLVLPPRAITAVIPLYNCTRAVFDLLLKAYRLHELVSIAASTFSYLHFFTKSRQQTLALAGACAKAYLLKLEPKKAQFLCFSAPDYTPLICVSKTSVSRILQRSCSFSQQCARQAGLLYLVRPEPCLTSSPHR